MTHPFPSSPWTPSAVEYFAARVPWGSVDSVPSNPVSPANWKLHGSSTIKRYMHSPRVYRDQTIAEVAEMFRLMGGPGLSPRNVAILATMAGKAHMDFGTAVEVGAFRSGEDIPEMTKARRRLAGIRAEQLREHPEAGKYLSAPGSALQVAHRWQDADSGLRLRARWDCCYWSDERPAVLDNKLWAGAHGGNLKRLVLKHGADIQAALYRRGAIDLWDERPPHTLTISGPGVCDKIFVRELPESMIQAADDRLSFALERLAKDYKTNDFSDPEELNQEL